MMFAERIRQLREDKQILQRQVSAFLEIDNALYCKIERGNRQAKREQVVKLAELYKTDCDELLSIWLADKIIVTIGDDRNITEKTLDIVQEYMRI